MKTLILCISVLIILILFLEIYMIMFGVKTKKAFWNFCEIKLTRDFGVLILFLLFHLFYWLHPNAPTSFEFVYADYQTAAPVIEREGDSIVMTCETEGAEIRYTIDGTEPTEESALYTEPIILNGNVIISAKAFKNDVFTSIVSTLEIADMQVANPYCEFDNLALVLMVDDPQASIWYTIADDADVADTEAWVLYNEPLTFTGDCTVSYFAHRDGFNDSEVVTFVHVYADYQAAAPEMSLVADDSQVEIISEIDGAEIRFTLDGTEPNENSELYTEPIELKYGLNTIHARVFVPGMYASEETVFTYDYIPTGIEGTVNVS